MFEEFFGYSASPFQQTPDSRFFFSSQTHRRALLHLTFGLSQHEGFVVITGEVGAGKTTLIERVNAYLPRADNVVAQINTTLVSGEELIRLVLASFQMSVAGLDKAALLTSFAVTLREHQRAGRRCILIIDEAQNLSVSALEELRMLSNFTSGGTSLLQTILLGQPQFRDMLARTELDQLRQRVIASFHLGAMSEEESAAYIKHRLALVGGADKPRWETGALSLVHKYSGGLPRRINLLCSRLLLFAALEETYLISADTVTKTADELSSDLRGGPQTDDPAELPSVGLPALIERIEALEAQVAHREWVFRRDLAS